MSQKHLHLSVKNIKIETKDTKTIEFWHPIHDTLKYKSGQFITLILPINGKNIRRSYSLSSSPEFDSSPSITVKRVENGLVSNYLNDEIKIGDTLEILEPEGRFVIPVESNLKEFVFVAAGSGIGPILAQIKTVLKKNYHANVHLIYGSRDENEIIFKKDLEELETMYKGRLNILYIISQPSPSWPGLKGRINQASFVYYLKQEIGILPDSANYFICGPGGMIEEVRKSLKLFDISEDQIFFEYFTSSNAQSPQENSKEIDEESKERLVKIEYEGETHEVMVKPNQTILEAALELDIDLPYSCQAGMCTACMGKCTQGKVVMDEEDGLTENEIKKGFILSCVAHPASDDVILNFD